MAPDQQWLEQYTSQKHKLAPPYNLETYFEVNEIAGVPMRRFSVGEVSVPTGWILVRDPLAWLRRDDRPYLTQVPQGNFTVTIAAAIPDGDSPRYASVKVGFTGKRSVRQEEALLGIEDLSNLAEGEFFGFNVDAGLAAIADKQVRDAYCDFKDRFHQEHPEGNIYDDYFAALFDASYQQHPGMQRSGGDWISWTIPGTDYKMPIFATGFGDGAYPVYYGYDDNDEICALFIHFIDVALAYGEVEEEE
ncbi:MAG TPA: DUF4241 domain-containing protein [Chitinophaga sp.]|uniref:DUF4241 domain-containing protein n=1 Tax=Chitinophaga sp. TaxID=1869181 RepID=UPI002D0D8B34|nr:DUF4241 domain-containing protein [Chitinophaga sp.]HVI47314.1 DUF4241 domain-containing protein [Chitinophaga sp.]